MTPISEGQKKREQLANKIDPDRHSIIVSSVPTVELREIAAELRKTCGTCKHDWHTGPEYAPYHECRRTGDETPPDGSGFCHRWEPAPPASEGTPEGTP